MSVNLHRKACLQNRLLAVDVANNAGVVRLRCQIELANLLIGGNLGHIHQIQNLDRLLADTDLRIMIDAKIPHGMGKGSCSAQDYPEQREHPSWPAVDVLVTSH